MMNLTKKEQQRYSRHLLMEEFGLEAQLKLKKARVLVIGAGGLGCPCLLYLAAAGVGLIGIADDDVVGVSNLQRQVLFNTTDVGKLKTETAKSHLLSKNALINIQTHPRVRKENVLEILEQYDVVIDGSDNFSTRYLLNDACVITGKPYIYGALFKFEGQVTTFNYQGGPTYRCLYPEAPASGEVPACGEAGVLGVLPGIIGTWQATEAIKVITGIGEPLNGKLFLLNLLTNDFNVIQFKAVPINRLITELGSYEHICGGLQPSIGYHQLCEWLAEDDVLLIDIREENEFERFNIGGLNIPLSELEDHLPMIQSNQKIVVICQTGIRSLEALQLLKDRFPLLDAYNLTGGIEAAF